jgi:hypothetical protein
VIRKFRIDFPLQSLFQSPTIAQMAALIAESQTRIVREGELERIVAELESMSEDAPGAEGS